MMMSTRKLFLAALGAASLLFATTAAHASDLTVRFAWYMPPHTAVADQGNAIAKKIEQLSHGSIKVETYPSGSLLKESTMASGLSNGTANMGVMAMHWWSKLEPSLGWDNIPFMVTDASTLLKKLHGKLGADVNKELNKHNVEVIGWGFYGYAMSYANNKHPIKVPSDLKGLRLRSEGDLNAKFLISQGATPVAMDSSEVYTAIQRGTLDGGVSGLSTIVSRKWYEVTKYITAIHYCPLVYPTMVNLSWWKSLTPEQRSIISKAAASTEKDTVAHIENGFKRDIAAAKAHGDHIYRPTKAQLAVWKKTAYQFELKKYLQEAGPIGKQFVKDASAGQK
ncbi:MAG: TRAP transporter substrate-binding protein [Acidihalobacter sp.]|uniref:TRAP transporter substrate-binding protein n=1 Tax=Acidihalobacter sp. TaxID=1872108 RepID=UPI00307F43A0